MSTEPEELDLVEALAARMRRKLRKNAHKTHWNELEVSDLLQGLKGEVRELEEALANEGPEAIADEAADVANFAAMIVARASVDNEIDHSWEDLFRVIGSPKRAKRQEIVTRTSCMFRREP